MDIRVKLTEVNGHMHMYSCLSCEHLWFETADRIANGSSLIACPACSIGSVASDGEISTQAQTELERSKAVMTTKDTQIRELSKQLREKNQELDVLYSKKIGFSAPDDAGVSKDLETPKLHEMCKGLEAPKLPEIKKVKPVNFKF